MTGLSPEMVDRLLREFGAIEPCAEPGCDAYAVPEGDVFEVGTPPGDIVVMQRWRCYAGHWYHLEDPLDAGPMSGALPWSRRDANPMRDIADFLDAVREDPRCP